MSEEVVRVGIIGNGEDKFSALGAQRAKELIKSLLGPERRFVSGHSPKGGVDIWTEEVAGENGWQGTVFHPAIQKWDGGYKVRNLQIAHFSDEVHVIVSDSYPAEFKGKKFDTCYHCEGSTRPYHTKSGACWTAKRFEEMHPGKWAVWHVVSNV